MRSMEIAYYHSREKKLQFARIEIANGRFQRIAPLDDKKSVVCDKVMFPGWINTHTHVGMSLFRNAADDMPLMEWLNKVIWPLEDHMDGSDVYAGALLSMVEMLQSGTTCFHDMYTFPLDTLRAAEQVGMRAVLGRGLSDHGGLSSRLEEAAALEAALSSPLHTTDLAPHAIYTLSASSLKQIASWAKRERKRIHIHASETTSEVDECLRQHNMTPIAWLNALGLIGPETILAHCVHVTEEDLDCIARQGATISLNLSSNCKLASGLPPIGAMRRRGIRLVLGTDGAASNNRQSMLSEMQLFAKLSKALTFDARAGNPQEVIAMATEAAAEALGLDEVGRIEEGYWADYVIYDLASVHNEPHTDPLSALLYSAVDADVYETAVAGEVLYRRGEYNCVDVQYCVDAAHRALQRLKERCQ